MISFLNKKELICTYDSNDQIQITQILKENHVPYQIKVTDRNSASPLSARNRNFFGSFQEKITIEKEYRIYVKKEDYELADHLIRYRNK